MTAGRGASWWFPVEFKRWREAARERARPWCYADRVLDLRWLMWELGSLDMPRDELAARWGVSVRTVGRHFTEDGRLEVLPEGFAKFWERRWGARSDPF